MKKKLLLSLQVFLFVIFLGTLAMSVARLAGISTPLSRFNHSTLGFNHIEDYDPSLSRLNSLSKLTAYCDSLYNSSAHSSNPEEFQKEYPNLAAKIVRQRFYHGYSYYGFEDNYIALLFSKVSQPGYSAIVIPDDILRHPNASCSQQSIVMMQLLEKKGFKTRKISFLGKKYGGHFCFETFYNGDWHFFDTNMEPDLAVLNAYNRPGISFLAAHPDILTKAYSRYPSEEILDIFPTYAYGPVNKFPAPNAAMFQKVSGILSYTIWLFFLAAYLFVRRRYKRIISTQHVWNSRFYFSPLRRGAASPYHAGYTAPWS